MPRYDSETAALGFEFLADSLQTQDENPKNAAECPLWSSFDAAREAGIKTTEAFLEAMRVQTLRSLSLLK